MYSRALQEQLDVGINDNEMNRLLEPPKIPLKYPRDDNFSAFSAKRKDVLIQMVESVTGKSVQLDQSLETRVVEEASEMPSILLFPHALLIVNDAFVINVRLDLSRAVPTFRAFALRCLRDRPLPPTCRHPQRDRCR